MSILESHITTNPSGVEDECAKLTIDDISVPFVLTNVVEPGTEYTFSFWVKSDENGSITAADSTFATTSKWTKHSKTFVADASDFQLLFDILGVYYIYHPQIEVGNIMTDWTPAPEDMATNGDVDGVRSEVEVVSDNLSEFIQKADGIYATVSSVEEKVKTSEDGLRKVVERIEQSVSTKMSKDQIVHEITARLDDGVTKVDTKTGITFDINGMSVDKTGAKTKTTISENGMKVYSKKDDNVTEDDAVLTANDGGVDAKNLKASTYLIVGGRSRFENYENNRTACFWIGGRVSG